MNRSTGNDGLSARELALSEYLDSLLTEPAPEDEFCTPSDISVEREQMPQAGFAAGPPTDDSTPEYLKFQTAGLSLAIPMEKVAGEMTWSADIVPVDGSPAWILGQRQFQDRAVQIVDIAMLIIPKARRDALNSASRSRYQHVVVIGNGRWGLACEQRDDQIDLSAKQVNWRTDQGTRSWLAGTLTKDRCALLDVDAMVKLLNRGQWSEC